MTNNDPSGEIPLILTGILERVQSTSEDPHAAGPGTAVPAEFTAHIPRKPLEPRSLKDPKALESLKNQQVVVHANGVEYRGLLQGSDGEDVYLRTETRYLTITLDRVTKVAAVDEKPAPLARDVVDHAFYGTRDPDEGK